MLEVAQALQPRVRDRGFGQAERGEVPQTGQLFNPVVRHPGALEVEPGEALRRGQLQVAV